MKRLIGKTVLKLGGWTLVGTPPNDHRFVLIAAPHTSNWDLVYMLAFSYVTGLDLHWMGKHTLFKGPIGWCLKGLGGVPIYRDERRNMVQQMADLFASKDKFILAIPPAGTRGYRDHWKSGFYHIANAAKVPIVGSFLDYKTRSGGYGLVLVPSGNISSDMEILRDFYDGMLGKFPENTNDIRLREELSDEPSKQADDKRH
ncbi:MAG: hypothetical protein ACI9OJ_002064 [Myxococcota bacterium]